MNKLECTICLQADICIHTSTIDEFPETESHDCMEHAHIHHEKEVILFSFQRQPVGSDHNHAGCNHSHGSTLPNFQTESMTVGGGGFQQINIFEETKHEEHVHCPKCNEHVDGDFCSNCNIRVKMRIASR